MKLKVIMYAAMTSLFLTGCGDEEAKDARAREKKADPTFMFWCFRQEIVSADYHIPEMKTAAAASYLQNRLKTVPGYVSSEFNLPSQTITVEYQSSTVRKMNFEEAIALAGFNVNHRPANPNAKVPAGVK